ncbi:MAG: LysM peptidoglycan-binding domain-containing protein [Bacteroidota bacterium]|nr:LysM peptidoglycan-binding domain-containing protein [Bacteroidota bacterium]
MPYRLLGVVVASLCVFDFAEGMNLNGTEPLPFFLNSEIPLSITFQYDSSSHGADTVKTKAIVDSASSVSSGDSTDNEDEKAIAELLEAARGHYLAALQAQTEGDSMSSASEFEEAIEQLNELSSYSDVESNTDFNELSRSVIEDYEKYIATIDSLGPNSSIFALREKLNFELEKIDISNIQIPQSLIPKTEVPLTINEYSKKAIAFFMGKGHEYMETWLSRSGKYFPIIKRIFQEEGVPPEIAHLSMCESGLNPVARSWAKAVGMWQFVKGTGSLYGLRSTYWYDERRDFEKSTHAAARLIKDLYSQYNDWHLVFVAYNAGPGWVHRGIRRTGSTDFWEMRRRLPRETRNYVPQYIATTLIAMNPGAFGFKDVEISDSLAYEYTTVDDCVDLSLLAACAGTDLETLQELNPELTQWCTPPNYKGYQLRIPYGTASAFAENYAKIPDDKKLDFATHTVRRGETVSTIAKRYGLQASVLLEVNKVSRRKKLKIGSTLVIPIQSKSVAAVVEAQKTKEITERERAKKIREERKTVVASSRKKYTVRKADYEPTDREKILYKVKPHETLGHIAEWFHVRASHIRNWNNIPYGRFIYPGQTLKIWVPSEKVDEFKKIASMPFQEKQRTINASQQQQTTAIDKGKDAGNWVQHKVKRGESLEKIASQYDVAIADIKNWNKLRSSKIKFGTYLEIYSPNNIGENGETVAAKTKDPANTESPGIITHVVKRGETLAKIADKYSVTISDVKKWNGLHSSKIMVGQKLKIQQEGDNVEKIQKKNLLSHS